MIPAGISGTSLSPPSSTCSNLAAIHAGGFSTGIYQTNSPTACQYIAQDSRQEIQPIHTIPRANIIVVGDLEQLHKVPPPPLHLLRC